MNCAQLNVAVVVEALGRCVLDGPVHPIDMAVGARLVLFGQTVLIELDAHGRQICHANRLPGNSTWRSRDKLLQ